MRVFKKRIFQTILNRVSIIGVVVSLSACSTEYLATTQNVPLFEEKNELQVYGGAAFGDNSYGGDFKAAYSITNHFAATAGGYIGNVDGFGFSKADFSLGYFTKLGDSRGIFEIYAGLGTGGPHYSVPEIKQEYRFNEYFIQPNIGGHFGPVDLAFSTRINHVTWDDIKEVYIEPAFTLRAGSDHVMFQFQVSTSIPTINENISIIDEFGYSQTVYRSHELMHLSLGVTVPIDFNKPK